MARVAQMNIFSWKEIEDLGDLERLKLVLNTLDDEKFIRVLEKNRDKGRDDYPIRAIWNSILALVVYQHPSIESLIRELKRNAQLRELCGFNPLKGSKAVPSSYAYSRFFKNVLKYGNLITDIFQNLVSCLQKELPNFGKNLAGDGKQISSFASKPNKNNNEDGRRDIDANFGIKKYRFEGEKGIVEKFKSWFGYKVHIVADADYELPIGYEVTKASIDEKKEVNKILEKIFITHPEIINNCEYGIFDKGYDDQKLIAKLWNEYKIKPIIDIRNMWKDKDDTRLLKDYENIVYDFKGGLYCYCLITGDKKPLIYSGFEKDRNTLKFSCPKKACGVDCKYFEKCKHSSGLRVKINENVRVFTPLPRTTYKWKKIYNKRTSIERINSRLDVSFGFGNHTIRGIKKMKIRIGIAFIVMLSMSLGRVRQNNLKLIRSLVKIA